LPLSPISIIYYWPKSDDALNEDDVKELQARGGVMAAYRWFYAFVKCGLTLWSWDQLQ